LSVQTYNYNLRFSYTGQVKLAGYGESKVVASDFQTLMNQQAVSQLQQKLGTMAGHWLKVNSIQSNVSAGEPHYNVPWDFWNAAWLCEVQGTTVINFDTDIADPTAHASPQLLQGLQDFISKLLQYLMQHPEIVVAVGVIIIVVVSLHQVSSDLTNTATGVSNALAQIGSNIGATIITVGILAIAGLTIYAVFFTQTGRKAGSKGYQTARRGYHAVRERLH
jgi:Tfp pilus assembly protein PilV